MTNLYWIYTVYMIFQIRNILPNDNKLTEKLEFTKGVHILDRNARALGSSSSIFSVLLTTCQYNTVQEC